MFGSFRIASTSLTCLSAYMRLTFFIALYIALARAAIEGDRGESLVSRGYAPNTSSISTILFGPVESFIALTAICRSISLFVAGNLQDSISYALRRGP